MKSLLVMGSINLDVSLRVARLPRAGETQMGHGLVMSPGGKGANQAHAACLMGSTVKMVGAVGDDDLAEPALGRLRSAGVDVSGVRRLEDATTGVATIHVTDAGENAIVVSPGANLAVRDDWVDDAVLAQCDTLLLQGEIPLAQSLALARRARAAGVRVMLNLAPARDVGLIESNQLHLLIVNEGELQELTAAWGMGADGATAQALLAAGRLQCDVVVTLGADGACVARAGGAVTRVAALATSVVDTTGAGDTFCGALAAGFNQGLPLPDALARASVAAGLACSRPGAQISQPTRQQVSSAWHRLSPPG